MLPRHFVQSCVLVMLLTGLLSAQEATSQVAGDSAPVQISVPIPMEAVGDPDPSLKDKVWHRCRQRILRS